MNESSTDSQAAQLTRSLGLPEAVLLGLGSIVGTGVFVSLGIAASVAESWVLPAVLIAGLVAAANGLSSAQLAAAHPVSGGTYEYGYRYLNPTLGFVAGWMFLCAKSASAATAALGFAGYLLSATGGADLALTYEIRLGLALFSILSFTLLVKTGIRRSNQANRFIVGLTLAALLAFIFFGLDAAPRIPAATELLDTPFRPQRFLQACALIFVAYTGYGRIATLGEEVRSPEKTIPRAIIATLCVSALLYFSVAAVSVMWVGGADFGLATERGTAPLLAIAEVFAEPNLARFVGLGAIVAMLGVLLNLILGLSRVVLSMARRGDLPRAFALIDQENHSPSRAVYLVGGIIFLLACVGDIKTTWSFSAFTVLIYYAITNLAALRLPASARLFPRIIPLFGLLSCLSLAFFVPWRIWFWGLALLALGLMLQRLMRRTFN